MRECEQHGQCRQCTVEAKPQVVARVREFVSGTLREWDMDSLVESAIHEASELLTNVLRHTSTRVTQVRLTRLGKARVRLEVWDNDPHELTPQQAEMPSPEQLLAQIEDDSEEDPDRFGSWGLPFVARVATDWGCEIHDREGKWVWVVLG